MPPHVNESDLKPRRRLLVNDDSSQDSYENPSIRYFKTVEDLSGNEIAIDGIVYNISGFDHPGGEIIKMFGGNDVSNVYKYNHLYHSPKALEKLKKVGVLLHFNEAYTFESDFAKELKREVMKVVRPGTEFATTAYYVRSMLYVINMYIFQIIWLIKGSSIKLSIAQGIAQALVGLNISHDANHGAISRKPWVNQIMGFTSDIIGGNKWNWMSRHFTHHAYLNDSERDPDARDGEPFLIFHRYPKGHPRRKWHHQFQAFLLLPLISFFWFIEILNPQILTLEQDVCKKLGSFRMDNAYLKSKVRVAVIIRVIYIYMNVINPFQWHSPKTALTHIYVAGVTGSICLAVFFVLSHNFEGSERDPTREYHKTGKKVCWYKNQAEASCTYGGRIAGWLTGGLNFQIEHHCFPRVNSAWYPTMAPIVRRVCEKHGVRYTYYPYIWNNMAATLRYMHQNGNPVDIELRPLSGNA